MINTVGGKQNILGVLCRGTDYTQKKPRGHHIQPTFDQLSKKVDEYMTKYKVDYIYVSTEDADYLEHFKSRYGEKVLYINQQRFGNLDVNYISEIGLAHSGVVKLNLDYYASLQILSRCDYFIAGLTAGTIGVSFMTEGFKDY